MNKNELINQRFIMSPDEFNIASKISINKLELSKAINVNAQSGEAGYAFTLKSYDKINRKFEDKVVNDLGEWIRNREKNLTIELKRFYEDLDY